jgi:phosphoglycerate dehydrogenase-like enzyme
MKVLIIGHPELAQKVYSPAVLRELPEEVTLLGPIYAPDDVEGFAPHLSSVEVLFYTWGGIQLNAEFLAKMPNLKAVLHGAGSIKTLVSEAFWERGIPICSAASGNAEPVAEYTYAHIVLALKQALWLAQRCRDKKGYPKLEETIDLPSLEDATVGICSLGLIGRLVLDRLRALNVKVIVHDPFLSAVKAEEMGVETVSLADLFKRGDVVSLHTPMIPETIGMIRAEHFASMKPCSTVINTARGAIIAEKEMIEVLKDRPDLQAILDVTHPEPPEKDSPLYTLPNVFLTPHIAGAKGAECQILGRVVVGELKRLISGEKLKYEVTQSMLATMA